MNRLNNSREWNAAEYHRLSAPQFLWGQRVLGELHLRGDECVLDAGCGTGKLTRLLLENLPRGRAVGLDVSRNMVEHAQQNLRPEFGERVSFVAADLSSMPFRNAFDGVFSTASFHWVLDHGGLFRELFAVLRPGGWLHAQCGGGSNLERLRERVRVLSGTAEYSPWLGEFGEPWYFSNAEDAASGLGAAGFDKIETGLEPAAIVAPSGREFEDYLRTFVLHRHLERLPDEARREAFVRELATASAKDDPQWSLDYCRLNVRAHKPQ